MERETDVHFSECLTSLDMAWISPILLDEARASRKTVFRDRSLKLAFSKGSKGPDERPFKTARTSHSGTRWSLGEQDFL